MRCADLLAEMTGAEWARATASARAGGGAAMPTDHTRLGPDAIARGGVAGVADTCAGIISRTRAAIRGLYAAQSRLPHGAARRLPSDLIAVVATCLEPRRRLFRRGSTHAAGSGARGAVAVRTG